MTGVRAIGTASVDYEALEQRRLDATWRRIDDAVATDRARLDAVTEEGTPLWESVGRDQLEHERRSFQKGGLVITGASMVLGGFVGALGRGTVGGALVGAAALGALSGGLLVAVPQFSDPKRPEGFSEYPAVDAPRYDDAVRLDEEHEALTTRLDRVIDDSYVPRDAGTEWYGSWSGGQTLEHVVERAFRRYDENGDGRIRVDAAGLGDGNDAWTPRATSNAARNAEWLELGEHTSMSDRELQGWDADGDARLTRREFATGMITDRIDDGLLAYNDSIDPDSWYRNIDPRVPHTAD